MKNIQILTDPFILFGWNLWQNFQKIHKWNHLSVPGYDGYAKVAIVPEQRGPLHLGAHPQHLLLLLLLVLVLLLLLVLVLVLLLLVLAFLLAPNPLGLLPVTPPANSSLTSTCTLTHSLIFTAFTDHCCNHPPDSETADTSDSKSDASEIKQPLLKVKMLNAQCSCSQIKSSWDGKPDICKFWRDNYIFVFGGWFSLGTLGVGWLAPYCGTPGTVRHPGTPLWGAGRRVSPAIRASPGFVHCLTSLFFLQLAFTSHFTLAFSNSPWASQDIEGAKKEPRYQSFTWVGSVSHQFLLPPIGFY